MKADRITIRLNLRMFCARVAASSAAADLLRGGLSNSNRQTRFVPRGSVAMQRAFLYRFVDLGNGYG